MSSEINLSISGDKSDKLQHVHLMPCKIEHVDGATVAASDYFWPTIKPLVVGGDQDEGRVEAASSRKSALNQAELLTASFRGRPLQGRRLQVPSGYKCVAVASKRLADRGMKNKQFEEFTYWNWDELPTDEDSVAKALQWAAVSEALHGYDG